MSRDSSGRTLKQVLEGAVDEMVEKGIFWNEAQAQFEKLFLLKALRMNQGNLSRSAETMGLHRNTLTKKIRQHGINPKTFH